MNGSGLSPISSDNSPLLQQDLEQLYRLLNQLLVAKPLPVVAPPPDTFIPLGQIEVKTSDGTYDAFVDGLEFDQADNFALSDSGNLAKVNQTANALLDANRHNDTTASTVVRGDMIIGNSTPKWTRLGKTNSAVLRTDQNGDPAWTAAMTNGQVVIGSTGAAPVPATLTAGSGITITNGAGSITITSTSIPPTGVPVWRSREYYVGIGSNLILDSSWWKVP